MERRLQILIAFLRIASGAYALYAYSWFVGIRHAFELALFLILYLIISGALLFLGKPALLWGIVSVDSLLCAAIALGHNPFLLPLFLLPGMAVGLLYKQFKAFILWAGSFVQIIIFAVYYKPQLMERNPYLVHFGIGMILADALGFVAAYAMFKALKEMEQNKSLLDLIQIGQQMGASLNYEKVSSLLMKVLTSMFDAHSYGFYAIEEKDGERMAFIKGVESTYDQVFLDFNPDSKETIFAQVLREKKVRIVDDLRPLQDRFLPSIRTFRGALISPILFEEDALGLIFLVSATVGVYGEEEASLLSLLSNQFAVTLKNILLYQQTAVMAITDSLTGLYTHGYFQDQLVKQVTDHKYNKKPLSVMILDVDHFKLVNDRFGHPQGDYILRQMAGLVKGTVRPKDVVCRYGGDEFVLITPGLDRLSAAAYAERIRKSVEDYQFMAGGKIARITISAGVSSLPETADTPKELIEAADKALYEAKNRGRNRIVYL